MLLLILTACRLVFRAPVLVVVVVVVIVVVVLALLGTVFAVELTDCILSSDWSITSSGSLGFSEVDQRLAVVVVLAVVVAVLLDLLFASTSMVFSRIDSDVADGGCGGDDVLVVVVNTDKVVCCFLMIDCTIRLLADAVIEE